MNRIIITLFALVIAIPCYSQNLEKIYWSDYYPDLLHFAPETKLTGTWSVPNGGQLVTGTDTTGLSTNDIVWIVDSLGGRASYEVTSVPNGTQFNISVPHQGGATGSEVWIIATGVNSSYRFIQDGINNNIFQIKTGGIGLDEIYLNPITLNIYNDGSNDWLCLSETTPCDGYIWTDRLSIKGNVYLDSSAVGLLSIKKQSDNTFAVLYAKGMVIFEDGINNQSLVGNAGTGVLRLSNIMTGVQTVRLQIDYTDLSAAATTNNITLYTLPVGTVLHLITAVVDVPATFADTYTISVGTTGAYDQLLKPFDAKAAADTEYGTVDAERGTELADADMFGGRCYSRTTGQVITVNANGNATNLDQATAGQWTITMMWSIR